MCEKAERWGGCNPKSAIRNPKSHRGAALLEVVFAITLFAAAGGVVVGGLQACAEMTARLRIEAKAADLAVTMLSGIQMGQVAPASDGPTDFEAPDDDWSWQIVAADLPPVNNLDVVRMARVRIVITHKPSEYSQSLTCLVSTDGGAAGASLSSGDSSSGTGGGS